MERLSIMNHSNDGFYIAEEDLKLRGVKDILYLCSDSVAGFKEILEESYPKTIHQRCIVHIIRNLTKYITRKEWKEFCDDLKKIYKVPNLESAEESSRIILEKWNKNKILIKKLFQQY